MTCRGSVPWRADILVAAIGRAGMITRDFVKAGAAVIDVGMNTVKDAAEFQRFFGSNPAGNAKREENFRKRGSTLMGDVHPEVAEVAGALTPVPGGVGPLTIAMLMFNTVVKSGEDAAGKPRAGTGESAGESINRRVRRGRRESFSFFSMSFCSANSAISAVKTVFSCPGACMLKVGLTGGIAAGKSVVGEMFVGLGAHLVQADRIAHSLMRPGEPVYNDVVRHFGREILNPDLSVNRRETRRSCFRSCRDRTPDGLQRASRIEELNRIVHPAVDPQPGRDWMQEKWAGRIRAPWP